MRIISFRCALRWIMLGCLVAFAPVAWGAAKPATRKAVALDQAKLEAFVGKYQVEPEAVLIISLFRDQLYAKWGQKEARPIFAESETVFFYKAPLLGAQLTFERDTEGKVISARYDDGRNHKTGKKISTIGVDPVEPPEAFDSPRLVGLVKALDGGEAHAIEKFWKEVQDHAPLVEPVTDTPHVSWVTFLFRGDVTTRAVQMWGGPAGTFGGNDGRGTSLSRLRGTDLWYRTVRMPNDARIVYGFLANLSCKLPDDVNARQKLVDAATAADGLNPHFHTTGNALRVDSIVELPEAPSQPYIVVPPPGAPRGKVTDHKIESDILKQVREYSIYTPPGYDKKAGAVGRLPLVIMFDGDAYREDDAIPGPTIIDNLIGASQIPPIIVAFVDQRDRMKELNGSTDFAAFIAKELVPKIRGEFHATADAKQTTIGGLSLGGQMACYCALNHPDVFGNVISQSGAFWLDPEPYDSPRLRPNGSEVHSARVIEMFVKATKVPVRFYLEAGRFESNLNFDLLAENRRFRDVLLAKGYEVTYSEFSGGHHAVNWRGTFSDALVAVTK
jgi:enterochelin esterase-like enzyme